MSLSRAQRSNLAKMAVSIALGAIVLWRVDLGAVAAALAKISPATAIGILSIYLVGQAVSAWRWSFALAHAGFVRSFGWVLRIYFGAMFFNLFAPSTFGGDAVRSYALGRDDARHATAAATVLFDRICGLATLCLLAAAATAVLGAQGWPPAVGVSAAVIGVGLIVGPGWLLPRLADVLPPSTAVTAMLRGPLRRLWSSPLLWLRCCSSSLLLHLLQIAAAWVLGEALGLAVPWTYYFVFHPLVIIFGALPISFSGFGVRELGYVWALAEMRDVPADTALAFGLAWSTLLLSASALGGVVALFGIEAEQVAAPHDR